VYPIFRLPPKKLQTCKSQSRAGLISNDEEVAHHIHLAEGDIQAGRMVRPDQVEESCIHHTAAGEAGRILVAGEVDRSPAVGVGRSPADHRILVVGDNRLGVDRTGGVGHNRRRSLLLEPVGRVIFRLWYRRKSRWLRA
jgi:hypothetical protein